MTETLLYVHNYDLRVNDNPVIKLAVENGWNLVPVFFYSEQIDKELGGASKLGLHHALKDLQEQYQCYGIKLCYLNQVKLQKLLTKLKPSKFAYAKPYEFYWSDVYQQIKNELASEIEIIEFNSRVLTDYDQVKNKSGNVFKVYTPFSKECRMQIEDNIYELESSLFNQKFLEQYSSDFDYSALESLSLGDLALLAPDTKWQQEWQERLLSYFDLTSFGAIKLLKSFIKKSYVNDYDELRNDLAADKTSKLSVALHYGLISVQRVFYEVKKAQTKDKKDEQGFRVYINEILWREFAHYILYHFPEVRHKNFNDKFDAYPWSEDDPRFEQWKKGLTGYPIVDAAMRQLWQTGWMHNRARMIVGSFLTKDLHIHWKQGAAWFNETLLDADLASNSLGWQWIAGCGVDAAPFFRVFNPATQAEKFDPDGNYRAKWLPESDDYPEPIVDHAQARKQALANYQGVK